MALKFEGNRLEKVYSTELNNLANVGEIAVSTGCGVTLDSGFIVDIASGSILFSGSVVSVGADSKTISTNTSSFTRIDTILVNSSGVISVLEGTPSAIPSPGDYDPTLFTALALIFIYPSATTLTTDDIKDLRVFNSIGTGTFTGDVIPSVDDTNVVGTDSFRFTSGHIIDIDTEIVHLLEQSVSPSTPSAGEVILYSKTDKNVYIKDSDGDEIKVNLLDNDIDHDQLTNTHNLTTDIDHNTLTNYAIAQHRIINDSGTSATELWSASKINTQLGTKEATLVSGTNIKTVNSTTLLGSGNLAVGTVTAVNNGNGMNFTNITGSGTVTLGIPTTLTASTTNAVTTSSHTHQITGFLPLTGGVLTGNLEFSTGTIELASGTSINEFSIDGTLAGNSDNAVPTEKAVKTYVDIIGRVPIGTVLPWLKSFTGVPSLLSNDFVECNGQVLSDADSPLNGETIPDLNGAVGTGLKGRFLRGHTESGLTEDSQNLAHTHGYFYLQGPSGNDGASGGKEPRSATTGSSGGDEARPHNYSVVWIMRVK